MVNEKRRERENRKRDERELPKWGSYVHLSAGANWKAPLKSLLSLKSPLRQSSYRPKIQPSASRMSGQKLPCSRTRARRLKRPLSHQNHPSANGWMNQHLHMEAGLGAAVQSLPSHHAHGNAPQHLFCCEQQQHQSPTTSCREVGLIESHCPHNHVSQESQTLSVQTSTWYSSRTSPIDTDIVPKLISQAKAMCRNPCHASQTVTFTTPPRPSMPTYQETRTLNGLVYWGTRNESRGHLCGSRLQPKVLKRRLSPCGL